MDLQDLQDDHRSELRFGEITEKIIGCAFEVIVELKAAKAIAPEHQSQTINYLGYWNRGRPTDQLWKSETRNQTIHTRQVNLSAN